MSRLREKVIEDAVVEYARAKGWRAYKWASPGNKGVLDRLLFKGGVCIAIEFKRPGELPGPLQVRCLEELAVQGIPARCIDSIHKGRAFIDAMAPNEPYPRTFAG